MGAPPERDARVRSCQPVALRNPAHVKPRRGGCLLMAKAPRATDAFIIGEGWRQWQRRHPAAGPCRVASPCAGQVTGTGDVMGRFPTTRLHGWIRECVVCEMHGEAPAWQVIHWWIWDERAGRCGAYVIAQWGCCGNWADRWSWMGMSWRLVRPLQW
jgi:hypothetical protein